MGACLCVRVYVCVCVAKACICVCVLEGGGRAVGEAFIRGVE